MAASDENYKEIGTLVDSLILQTMGKNKRKQFSILAGIDQSQFNKMIRGELGWTLQNLDKVISALNGLGLKISRSELIHDMVKVPVVAEIGSDGVPWPPGVEPTETILAHCSEGCNYAVKVSGDYMRPFLRHGSVLKVRSRAEDIIDGDMVIYFADGMAHVAYLIFRAAEISINSFVPHKPPIFVDIDTEMQFDKVYQCLKI